MNLFKVVGDAEPLALLVDLLANSHSFSLCFFATLASFWPRSTPVRLESAALLSPGKKI